MSALRSAALFYLALAGPLLAQTLTITAPDDSASEAGSYPGLFRITRTGDTSTPLVVSLTYGGTATVGEDYEALPATVTLPAGAASLDLVLAPINDPIAEALATETVVATLVESAGYSISSPSSATVGIVEDETLSLTAPFLFSAVAESATSVTLRWLDLFETETKFRVQYRLAGASAWTSIDNLPPNTTARTVTGLLTGKLYEFRVDAFQGATASKSINPVLALPLAPNPAAPAYASFEQWRRANGLAGGLRASAGLSTHDPDGDSRTNLLEYALGTDPLARDASPLEIEPAPSGLALSWPERAGLPDVTLTLHESDSLLAWTTSPLAGLLANGRRSVLDSRGGDRRFYRLSANPLAPLTPSSVITCWGDSLTGNPGTYATRLPSLLPGARTIRNGGIGGDTSMQIADRLRGLVITSPAPAYSISTPAGTPVRIVASRTTHARVMNPSYGGQRPAYAATIAKVSRVEFFDRGAKIGESSTPLATTVTVNRAVDATRLLASGHPFTAGDVVHFPTGPLPAPLIVGKTYFVRDVDAHGLALVADDVSFTIAGGGTRLVSASHDFVDGDIAWFRPGAAIPGFFADRVYHVRDADASGFALADTPGGPALATAYGHSGVILGKAAKTPVALGADFASPTLLQGPFVLDWIHPGGPTALSLRTHTDRDSDTFIFWMGRNNNARPHEVYADLRAAVDHIKALDARFLILGVTNGGGESLGSGYYFGAVNLNHLLRREYPDNFIDVRTALIRAASADSGDQLDRAADIPPRSLRSDPVHFNDAGHQLIAELVAAELVRRGW